MDKLRVHVMTPTGLGRFLKRGRAGQSIVILALGFIALIAFVGIVTDVSLLFVRYSTLRRAVDAAAVAAATQMRRVQNTSTVEGVDTGGSTSVANMNLAARQFLNLYSLDPSDVTVETCQSQMVAFQVDGQPTFTGIFDDSGRMVMSPEQQEKNYNDVCKDGRKLVRVTASIQSPTVFLRMLGMQDVTLTVSSISETAVLDVALVLDVSESMLSETTYTDYETQLGHPVARILPGRGPTRASYASVQWWDIMNTMTEPQIKAYQLDPANESGAEILTEQGDDYTTFADDSGDVDQTFPVRPVARVANGDGTYSTIDPADWDTDPRVLRAQCRTRFWPNAENLAFGAGLTQTMLDDYRNYFFDDGSGDYSAAEKAYFDITSGSVVANPTPGATTGNSAKYRYTSWIPTFDYYGCCNDPDGDFDFSDLVCQPMKQARDASVDFLRRVDFPRGDSVAIITFSQSAHVIRPNGEGTDPWIRGDQQLATDVVQKSVGVRAEPVYYYDDPASYGAGGNRYEWDKFTIGSDANGNQIPGDYGSYWDARQINALTTFPVHNNCPFDQATLLAPQNPHAGDLHPLLYGIQSPPWTVDFTSNSFFQVKRSYDYRGSCRDTNIGGAMAASGNIFNELGQGRTEGSVWVMVLLSDGAAGATDPITNHDNPNVKPDGTITYQQQQSNPYGFDYDANGVADRDFDDAAAMATWRSTLGAEYGSFGFCPYGTQTDPTRLVTQNDFPYCSDVYPNSRHSCASTDASKQSPKNNPVYIDLGSSNTVGCKESYDPDDYARDWADYVAGVTQQNASTTQLPVIFTIGFNLTYPSRDGCTVGDSGYDSCLRSKNTESYLGEELLRYIGDAGDNFRIDDDYWQWKLAKLGVFSDPDSMTTAQKETYYGLPGPCENPGEDPIASPPSSNNKETDNHQMASPGANCGNYFNAPDQTQLAEVFNEIASRMFTRLSQ